MSLDRLEKIASWFAKAAVLISALGLILMTVIVGWQVFGRFVLNQSPDWSEQAALALMIWYISLAAAAGVRENFHIRIVFLENAASKNIKKRMQLLNNFVVLFCGVIMCVYGVQLVVQTWAHAVPTLPITRGMVYLAVPVSGFFIALFSFEHIAKLLKPAERAP